MSIVCVNNFALLSLIRRRRLGRNLLYYKNFLQIVLGPQRLLQIASQSLREFLKRSRVYFSCLFLLRLISLLCLTTPFRILLESLLLLGRQGKGVPLRLLLKSKESLEQQLRVPKVRYRFLRIIGIQATFLFNQVSLTIFLQNFLDFVLIVFLQFEVERRLQRRVQACRF